MLSHGAPTRKVDRRVEGGDEKEEEEEHDEDRDENEEDEGEE